MGMASDPDRLPNLEQADRSFNVAMMTVLNWMFTVVPVPDKVVDAMQDMNGLWLEMMERTLDG